MSSRLFAHPPSSYYQLYAKCTISSCSRPFASSSKLSLDASMKSRINGSQPELIIFDSPSRPSELTRRSAPSSSLTDYFSTRRRLAPSPARQTRSSSASTSSNTASSSSASYSMPRSVPTPQVFDKPSKPRAYYTRPQRKQELPKVESKIGITIALTLAGLGIWGAFLYYATNMERVSSSVVRQLASNLRNSEPVHGMLGDNIHLEGKWWLGGEPYINGAINMLQGNVDVSFRIAGSKGGGTVYFTSVRQEKGQSFTILRSKVICDNGEIIHLKSAQDISL